MLTHCVELLIPAVQSDEGGASRQSFNADQTFDYVDHSPKEHSASQRDRMSLLRLPRALLDRVCFHAEQQYPRECCGVLLGTPNADGWTVVDVVRAGNSVLDSPKNRYAIAPLEFVKIMSEARSRNLEVAGFYHSHPDHPAMWSQTDLTEAHWIGCSYLITEVSQGRAAATNSFRLAGTSEEDKKFIPETLELLS